jgi:DHA1 family bicyclomycin/chloramphenicol resistance-like MFS transporter
VRPLDNPTRRAAPRRAVLAVLALMSMMGPLSLNIVIPILPTIQRAFETTRDSATLVLAVFLAAMAVSQLVLGPLADRFGRKPVLVFGIALYILASIAAAFAASIGALLIARVVQSLGATVGLPLARTIIRDLYDRESSASMIGYVTTAMVIAPMIAPLIGAHAAEAFGWQAIFVVCAALGILTLTAVTFFLPETRPTAIERTTTADVARRSVALLKRWRFIGFAGTVACASGSFFAFQAGALFLVIDVMGVPESTYALWFIVGALAYMAGNFSSGRFSRRLGVDRMVTLGNWGGLVGSLILLGLGTVPVMHPAALFVPMAIVAYFNGLVIPNAIAGAVSVDVNAAGAASGLAGFVQSALSAAVSFIVGAIVATTPVPIGIAMTIISALGLVCGWIALKR